MRYTGFIDHGLRRNGSLPIAFQRPEEAAGAEILVFTISPDATDAEKAKAVKAFRRALLLVDEEDAPVVEHD